MKGVLSGKRMPVLKASCEDASAFADLGRSGAAVAEDQAGP